MNKSRKWPQTTECCESPCKAWNNHLKVWSMKHNPQNRMFFCTLCAVTRFHQRNPKNLHSALHHWCSRITVFLNPCWRSWPESTFSFLIQILTPRVSADTDMIFFFFRGEILDRLTLKVYPIIIWYTRRIYQGIQNDAIQKRQLKHHSTQCEGRFEIEPDHISWRYRPQTDSH